MSTDFAPADQATTASSKARFRQFFTGLWQPTTVVTVQPDVEAELVDCRPTAPIALAAKGDAFDFSVRPTFTWRARRMTRSRFEELIDAFTPDVLDALRLRTERVARTFEPHRSEHLEQDLNARLSAKDWAIGPIDERLTCRPEVFVLPDPRVRESMQPYWQQRIRMQAEHELAMRRAELIRERTQAWSRVMKTLERDPRSRHAASLVEHEGFAEVFTAMTQGRKDELLRLIDLLEKAGRSYNGIGLYEYAEGLDAALAEYRKRAGMDEDE